MPLCLHFANNGRCKNGDSCLYPHVRVGKRDGICRDFAVLGYCEKGIDCQKQHLRECPDFAETSKCANRACKLPHVIRASHKRQELGSEPSTTHPAIAPDRSAEVEERVPEFSTSEEDFIPLTFHEDSDDDDSDDDQSSGHADSDND